MPDSARNKARRRAAKATVDFATGEVHDRLIDAAESPESALEQLSAEERQAAQVGGTRREKGARAAAKARRGWVKERKIP